MGTAYDHFEHIFHGLHYIPVACHQLQSAWFLLFLTFTAILLATFFSAPRLKLPPGPPRWRLMGSLLFMCTRLKQVHLGILASGLEKKYGPIITLRFGSVPVIVLSGSEIVHEALVLRGSLFASRPAFQPEPIFTKNSSHYVNSASHGPFWRATRRNIANGMLSSAKFKALRPVRDAILESLMEKLKDQAAQDGGVVPVFSNCRMAIFKILMFMCFGRHVEDTVALELHDLTNRIFDSQSSLILSDFFFNWERWHQRPKLRKRLLQLSMSIVEEHKQRKRNGQVFPDNYIDTLLQMELESGDKLNDVQVLTLCTEFVGAGTDPTAVCLEWTMAHLVMRPEIQAKVYEEIEGAIGKRLVQEEDLENLPYLHAVIKESLRLHPPGHFTLPHAATQACKLAGYDIPANAMINVHLAAISRDPKIWVDPRLFEPERFLGEEDVVDMTGTREVKMIPFGAGRRRCPGAALAMMHAALVVGRFVQGFEWSRGTADVMDMSEAQEFMVVMRMKTPLRASIKERHSNH